MKVESFNQNQLANQPSKRFAPELKALDGPQEPAESLILDGEQRLADVELIGSPQQRQQFLQMVKAEPAAWNIYQQAKADQSVNVKLNFQSRPDVTYGTGYGLGAFPKTHVIDLEDIEATRKADPKVGAVLAKSATYHEVREAYKEALAAKGQKICAPNTIEAYKRWAPIHNEAFDKEGEINNKYGVPARGQGVVQSEWGGERTTKVPYGPHMNVLYTEGVQPLKIVVKKH